MPYRQPLTGYDFVFAVDPGRLYRLKAFGTVLRLYRLDGRRWLFERTVSLPVARGWLAHAATEPQARAYLALPLPSEV